MLFSKGISVNKFHHGFTLIELLIVIAIVGIQAMVCRFSSVFKDLRQVKGYKTMNSTKGITLIELLVVIMIVGILAAVAIPIYTNYMQRARRVDGKTALEQFRAAQEMCRAENGGYSTDINQLRNTWGVPAVSGDYNIDFQATAVLTPSTFTAEAAPNTARQLSDGSLFINQDGRKWDKDGVFWPDGRWAK